MTYILYGAGAAGRYALKYLRGRGEEVVAFADNNPATQNGDIQNVPILSPVDAQAQYPDAKWVACAISRPAATEIRASIRALGVDSVPLWQCIDVCHGLPSADILRELCDLTTHDPESVAFLCDQYRFRQAPDYDDQNDPSPMSELYFPPFIGHLYDEHFVDCGACDGDTVKAFMERWEKWGWITAFEPDAKNRGKLERHIRLGDSISVFPDAISDHAGVVTFTSNGDYSSHIGGTERVPCSRLDDVSPTLPTFIKMDIEGSELEALWGARRILKEHSPVLAICAYHTSDHLWQIPLLIHAIQPDYKLFFRRYAEGAWETVWYAVPPGRAIPRVPASHESYSDNHEG